jgi:hypothetical protein
MLSHVRQWLELVVLFGALLLADHYWLAGDAFAGFEPNPYWLPILAMALAYGSGMGLAATLIASAIWVLSPHQWPAAFNSLAIQLHLSKLPLLWVVTAVMVGELTASRRSTLDKLQQRFAQLCEDSHKLSKALSRVRKINRELQVRIVVGQNAAEEAIEVASGLLRSRHPSQMEALGKLIALATHTEDFTYCHLRGESLTPLLWGGSGNEPPRDVSSARWSEAVLPGCVVLHDEQEQSQPQLEGLGLVAIRVNDPATGSTGAILLIHSAKQLRLNPTNISKFHQLSEALSLYMGVFTKAPLRLADPEDELEDKVA